MTDHLSDFALDRARTSGAPPPPHVEQCAECRRRLEALETFAKRSTQNPAFSRIAATLAHAALPPDVVHWWRRPWFRWVVPVPLVLAAALAVVVAIRPPEPTERAKGAVSVDLIRSTGTAGPLKLGERVGLRVDAVGHAEVAVFIVDEGGTVEQLWPVDVEQTAMVPAGGRLADLEVTSGSVVLIGLFFDRHASTRPAIDGITRMAREGGVNSASRFADEAAHSVRSVEVLP